MKTFRARVEVRHEGAIGLFEWRIFDRQADDISTAEFLIHEDIRRQKLEPRCFCIRELIEGQPDKPWPYESQFNEAGTIYEKFRGK